MLVNLAYLLKNPTGTTTYALNLIPYLWQLNPLFLATPASGLAHYYPVPAHLTAERGTGGHIKRLLWTQFKLPDICQKQAQQLDSALLFSPITEAPLGSNCRFVVVIHDLIPLRFRVSKALRWLYKHYVPRVLAAAEHVICNSQATANDVVQFYGMEAKHVTPILLAYDNKHFRRLPLPQLNYFLVLGRHAPYKNIGIVIDAFSRLPQSGDYELWIAGPQDHRYTPALRAQTQDLALTQQVKFLDYVPYSQLPKLLNQAIALVFPSLWEGFGLPVLEAMACGTPVIASRLASIPEVTGDAAILVNPHSTSEITAAMVEIIQDDQCRYHLSRLAIQQASRFSWQSTGQSTVALLSNYL